MPFSEEPLLIIALVSKKSPPAIGNYLNLLQNYIDPFLSINKIQAVNPPYPQTTTARVSLLIN
tara:strand:- start:11 stop:199 length:189 start_codon:yes stop_codon:yes gene_type:complete